MIMTCSMFTTRNNKFTLIYLFSFSTLKYIGSNKHRKRTPKDLKRSKVSNCTHYAYSSSDGAEIHHYDVVYSVCLRIQFRILCYPTSDGTGFTLARILIYTAVSSHEQL